MILPRNLLIDLAAAESGLITDIAGTPIIRATYAVAAGAGLPAFSVDAITPIAVKDLQCPIAPGLTAADMAVTVTFDTE